MLDEVVKAADEMGVDVQCIQKVTEEANRPAPAPIHDRQRRRFSPAIGTSARSLAAPLGCGRVRTLRRPSTCCSSTRPRKCRSRTCSRSRKRQRASSLLGDPRQLEQPMQGSHPEGTDVSALDHILGGHARSRPTAAVSWRKHGGCIPIFAPSRPNCSTKAAFIRSRASTGKGSSRAAESRLRPSFLPIAHEGNQAPPLKRPMQSVTCGGNPWIQCHLD